MSDYAKKATSVAEKIKALDFGSAYEIYFQAMESGIAKCPLDMIDFSDEIESHVNDPHTWDEWEEWTWEHESTRPRN